MNNQLVQQPAPELQIVHTNDLIMNTQAMNQIHLLAQTMSSGIATVPKHLRENVGDCMAIIMQAMQWGMNPFAVAQKTHLVNGVLGYESQLVNAVIINRAPITGRLNFEWFGDWTKSHKDDKRADVGVIVSATFVNEHEPRSLTLTMNEVGKVRNSPLWEASQKQQIAYLATKYWARLYCPDVILGVYRDDELPTYTETSPLEPTTKQHSGSPNLKARLNANINVVSTVSQEPAIDTTALLHKIHQAVDLNALSELKLEAGAIKSRLNTDQAQELKKAFEEVTTQLSQPELIYSDADESLKILNEIYAQEPVTVNG